MLIQAKIANQSEWLFAEELPDKYRALHTLSERELSIQHTTIRIKNYQLSTDGFFMLHSEFHFTEDTAIETHIEGEAVICQFILLKNQECAGNGRNGKCFQGYHNIRFIPSQKQCYPVKGGQEYIYFLIVLSKDYYLRMVDTSSPLHEEFMVAMDRGQTASLMKDNLYITPEMRSSIDQIMECRYEGALKRMFVDARVMELIIYQLEQYMLSLQQHLQLDSLPDDLEKLELVRHTLEQNFTNPPTQRELARKAALNESKLRTGFKRMYGTTIYDFVNRLRMLEARRLITEERNTNMNEISMLLGFKHQGNFTRAFKRYYGLSPSEVAP